MVNQVLINQIFSDSSPKRVLRAFRASFNACDVATKLMLYLRLLEEGLVTRHLARALLRALGPSVDVDRTPLLALAKGWSLYVAEDFETLEQLRRDLLSTTKDYKTLYFLRQVVQFSPALATNINETLPKTKELCPASNNLDVAILFSCDKDYFEHKFLTFIAPVLRTQPRVENVYLHLMDGDHNHPSLLELQAKGLTILEDRYELKIDKAIRDKIPDTFKEHSRRTWYACARFSVALRLLDVHAKVTILDVDLNITKSIESIQRWYGERSFDIAVRKPKRHRASGVDYWLYESAYAATTNGKQFLATLSDYLDQLLRSGLAFWTLDQCSFNAVIRSKLCENFKILNLPSGNEVGAHRLTFHRGHNDEHVKGAY